MKVILNVRKYAIKSVTIFTLYLAFISLFNPVLAQYFPSVPPTPIVVIETPITVSYTEPQRVITIDIAQFDPEQALKKITLYFKEPVLTVSFTIYLLAESPPQVPELKETALVYFTIRAHEALLENVERAVMTFAVEKAVVEEKGVDVETIILNMFFERVWEELSTEIVDEDEKFLYFESEGPGMSHFAVSGVVPPPFPVTLVIMGIVVIAVVATVAGIYLYRRRNLMTQ